MELNLLDENVVSNLINEITGSENLQRKTAAWGAYQISHGDILPYVTAEVKKLLPQSWSEMRISDISISEKVITKLAQAYREKPIRSVAGNDTDTEFLEELYDDMDADEKFSEFDYICNLNRYGLLWVNYRDEIGLQLTPLHPFEFDVVRSKANGSLECVILNYPNTTITHAVPYNNFNQPDGINQTISNWQADSAATSSNYAIWTKNFHVFVKGTTYTRPDGKRETKVEYYSIPENPTNINPLGMIPFVYFSKDDGGNPTDYPVPNPITRQSIFYNVLKTDELSAASLQGYGIRILSGTSEMLNNIQRLSEGLTTAVELPQPEDPSQPKTELKFERPGPDLVGQRGSYDSYLIQVLSQHGINGGSIIDYKADNYNSGLDRLIANADVQNVIKKNQGGYARVEKYVFEIIEHWLKITGGQQFAEDSDLNIVYPRPQVLVSDKEMIENLKALIDLGLIEKHRALMQINPSLTEDEAKEQIAEIEAEKAARMGSFNIQTKNPAQKNGDMGDMGDMGNMETKMNSKTIGGDNGNQPGTTVND
jgi:hypothetical protein